MNEAGLDRNDRVEPPRREARLTPVEVEVIQLFVQFSRAVGQPRSIAEIYGLLFVSPVPLTLDDLAERLELSKGSASQGLKYLRELGAVRVVAVAEARRARGCSPCRRQPAYRATGRKLRAARAPAWWKRPR